MARFWSPECQFYYDIKIVAIYRITVYLSDISSNTLSLDQKVYTEAWQKYIMRKSHSFPEFLQD